MSVHRLQFLSTMLLTIVIFMVACKSKKQAVTDESSFRNIPVQRQDAFSDVEESDSASNDYFDRNYIRNIDHVYNDEIKTVLLHPINAPLSPPVIFINDGKKLRLSFDDLASGRKEFTYQIKHCNAGWEVSELIEQDYIEGFTNDIIQQSAFSENTFREYTNYTYEFPNEYFKLTKSGNYLLHIFHNKDIILTKRFIIVENKISISTNLKRPTLIEHTNYKQELDFVIKHANYEILDPYKSLKVVMMQNNRSDNVINGIQPNFVKNNELVYDHDEDNLFEGGNEFRGIDLKNLKFKPSMIEDVVVEKDKYYHVYLMDDEPRSYLRYSTMEDINGKFLIKKDDALNTDIEADYLYVHFSLPYDMPETNGDIYIFGQLTDWQLNEDYKMIYDYEQKKYTRTLLLKQGYYNYNYTFLSGQNKVSEIGVVEGTHFETENDYSIYVYYQQAGDNYDRCIGFKNLNSVKRK